MNENINSLKNKALFITISILVGMAVVFLFVIIVEKDNFNKKEIDYLHSQVNLEYAKYSEHLKLKYSRKIRKLLRDEEILKAFEQRDREKLYRLVEPYFERLKKEEPNFEIICFGLPDLTVFLRAHRPDLFGDDISKLQGVKEVLDQKVEISGFMITKLGLYYRINTPVFYNNKYIGMVSYGINIAAVNDLIHKEFKSEVAILIDTKKSIKSQWYGKIEEGTIGDQTVISSTSDFFEDNSDLIDFKSEFNTFDYHNNSYVVKKGIDIHDIKNNKIATVLIANDISKNLKDFREFISVLTLLSIVFIGLIMYILFELYNIMSERIDRSIKQIKEQDNILAKQTKLADMGQMIDSIAHQWKTPIGVIKMRVQMLEFHMQMGELNQEKVKETVDSSLQQIDHLVETIDEFRKFFKTDTKKEMISLKILSESVLKLMHDELIKSNLNVSIDSKEDLSVNINQNEFKHVLITLISNSKDAFISNNIDSIKRGIEIVIDREEDKKTLSITDHAGGIPSNIIDKIFEARFTTKEDTGGTGVGLYLAKQIIEKNNGTIEVKSSGASSSFIITFKD